MRLLNTAGPVKPEKDYFILLLERVDKAALLDLIENWKYFILPAPRQTGKTSALLALCDELNAAGHYRAVYVNIEGAQTAREDVSVAMQTMLSAFSRSAQIQLDDWFVVDHKQYIFETTGAHDALVGDTLISVLRRDTHVEQLSDKLREDPRQAAIW